MPTAFIESDRGNFMNSFKLSPSILTDSKSLEKKVLMSRLLQLPACTLITTGRTGTDFLQSLLDSHPQVLTFNGILCYHDFWAVSQCVNAGFFDLSDFLDEFIGHHIEKFKSKYDLQERKDQLGDTQDQFLDIDIVKFKKEMVELMDGLVPDSRNTLVAIYAAYAICLGQDLSKKTVFFHHIHHVHRLGPYLKDFPGSKIICMTRDPRANFVSGILNWRRYDPESDRQSHLTFYINRILNDADVLKKFNNTYIVIRLEDLGDDKIIMGLCRWLGIVYDESLKRSTWGGMLWHADRLSGGKKMSYGFSEALLRNNWENILWRKDKYVLNCLMFARLKCYGYLCAECGVLHLLLVAFLIPWPLKFECHYWSPSYLSQCVERREYKKIMHNALMYLKRILLFYRYYIKTLTRVRFEQPLLKADYLSVGGGK